jgi:hypothetical protein
MLKNNKNEGNVSRIMSTHSTSKLNASKRFSGSDVSNHFFTEEGRIIHTVELDEEVEETLASYRG